MKDFKSKIESLSVESNNIWRIEAKERREKKWLIYSSEIALRILALIENDEELSQAKLADTLKVSRQQINKIIQGKENLTLETIYKLSQALNFELITFPPYKDSYMLGSKIVNGPFEGKSYTEITPVNDTWVKTNANTQEYASDYKLSRA